MTRVSPLLLTILFTTISCDLLDLVGGGIFNGDNPPQIQFGAEANPTGNPIGGGEGYSEIFTNGDYVVHDAGELLLAFAVAQPGEVIYVAPDSEINMNGNDQLFIPEGVTLAGNRGQNGSPGPLLYMTYVNTGDILFRPETGTRITGLRIKGPEADLPDIDYDVNPATKSRGFRIHGATQVEIDNCEISNWQRAGIEVEINASDVYIHHNHLHDVHSYPVSVLSYSTPPVLIEANRIDWIWHATAGAGDPGSGYEARYNIITRKAVPDSWQPYDGSHAIDMHADDEIEASRDQLVGADVIRISYNTFIEEAEGDPSVALHRDAYIRGVPRIIAEFHHNCFLNTDPAQAIVHMGGNVWVHHNLYGPDSTLVVIADETTPQILFHNPPPPDEEVPIMTGDFLEVDVEVNVLDQLELSIVRIELNGEEIYAGTGAPAPGELMIDLTELDPAMPYHELLVKAVDNRGVIGQHMTVFRVE